MVSRYVSRFEKLGAPRWVRGFGAVMLALILAGNLALITVSWAPRGGARAYAGLGTLWILALIALRFLLRLCRAMVSSQR
jgi:hypothetical protein